MDKRAEYLLNLVQKEHQEPNSSVTPDNVRAYISKIAEKQGSFSAEERVILNEQLTKYGKLIDDLDGVNNFADVAIKIGRPSASPSWTSDKEIFIKALNSMKKSEPAKKVDYMLAMPSTDELKSLEHLVWVPSKAKPKPPVAEIPKIIAEVKTSNPKNGSSYHQPLPKPSFLDIVMKNKNKSAEKRPRIVPSDPFQANDEQKLLPKRFAHPKNARHIPDDISTAPGLRTASDVQNENQKKKTAKYGLGHARPSGPGAPFVPPFATSGSGGLLRGNEKPQIELDPKIAELMADERLKGLEAGLVERIVSEIVDEGPGVKWDSIAGLEDAKSRIQEVVVLPMLRPDLFKGIRAPAKGLLLFGPPGTGKTLIGKCVAGQSKATFFNISASSLTSKWVGDGEKMIRALFAVARVKQPSVIFIDEIDSLLTQRNDNDHESSRRMKTEFLLQFDGLGTKDEEKLLIIGATNRPSGLDEAARRRFNKRLYIPLPEASARQTILMKMMTCEKNTLTGDELQKLAQLTDGYSCADTVGLCKEAALGPVRAAMMENLIETIALDELRSITFSDFEKALQQVKSSVSPSEIGHYEEFNRNFGALTM